MNPTDEKLMAMLSNALVGLGSSVPQARVMAAQLLKRARQIAAERNIDETLAMAELLEKVRMGRRGEYTGETGTPPT